MYLNAYFNNSSVNIEELVEVVEGKARILVPNPMKYTVGAGRSQPRHPCFSIH